MAGPAVCFAPIAFWHCSLRAELCRFALAVLGRWVVAGLCQFGCISADFAEEDHIVGFIEVSFPQEVQA